MLGGGDRGVVLAAKPANTSGVPLAPTVDDAGARGRDLAGDARRGGRAASRSRGSSLRCRNGAPGVVVGAPLDLGSRAPYELYFVYPLTAEQQTLTLIQRVLGLGAACSLRSWCS